MLALLQARYNQDKGNGPRYVSARHVRSHAGFDARRTCDFVAMDLWPSKGLAIHGHEVKVSRGDWLRELKEPAKSAEFMRHVDYWWLVSPKGVAKPDELPDGWGLMEVAERTDQVVVRAEGPPFVSPYGPNNYNVRDVPRAVVVQTRFMLRVAKPAPLLSTLDTKAAWSGPNRRDRGEVSRSFTAALLRAAVRTAQESPA